MIRARTVEEYVALIQDAIYEVREMRAAIDYDEDYMGDARNFVGDLESSLQEILDSMNDGSYCWRTGDLKFIPIIEEMDERIMPFRALLIRINDTHKNGLETEQD